MNAKVNWGNYISMAGWPLRGLFSTDKEDNFGVPGGWVYYCSLDKLVAYNFIAGFDEIKSDKIDNGIESIMKIYLRCWASNEFCWM